MKDDERRALHRKLGLLPPALNAESPKDPSTEAYRAAAHAAADVFLEALGKLIIEQKLDRIAVAQAALAAVQMLLGGALKDREINAAGVRYMFESYLEDTVVKGLSERP